jgi:hypothetical protein
VLTVLDLYVQQLEITTDGTYKFTQNISPKRLLHRSEQRFPISFLTARQHSNHFPTEALQAHISNFSVSPHQHTPASNCRNMMVFVTILSSLELNRCVLNQGSLYANSLTVDFSHPSPRLSATQPQSS